MKILHVTKKYPNMVGGDATVVSNLEYQLEKIGHEVSILTTNCDDVIDKKNITKFGLKEKATSLDTITFRRILSLIGLYFKSYKIIKKIKPDVVHSHTMDMGCVISYACRKNNIPIVNTCHGGLFHIGDRDKKRKFLEKILLKLAKFNKIITVNPLDLAYTNEDNVLFVPNGINLDKFKTKNKVKNLIPTILFVGRIEEAKGIGFLIQAAEILKHKHLNFKINLIGEGTDLTFYKKLVSDLMLETHIKFLGRKNWEDLIKCYSSSDMFVLPSLDEAFPATILEAWASGTPIIATKVGGIPKICKNKENALIIPPAHPEEIADSISVLMKNQDLRIKLAENGLKKVKNYSWDKVAKQIEKIYKGTLK